MTALDDVRMKAERAGLPEATCKSCSWFEPNKDGGDMGACRKRRGEVQFRLGICLSWDNGNIDESRIDRNPNVVEGHRPIFPRADAPEATAHPPSTGRVDGLECVEDGCDGLLELRWSARFQTYFYGCSKYPTCNGTLPANEDGSPRGEPRTRELQGWRKNAHASFDRIWQDGHTKRQDSYSWLRAATGLDHDSAHMSRMSIDQCKLVIECVETKGPGTEFWEQWKTERAERKKTKRRNARRSRTASSPKRSSAR